MPLIIAHRGFSSRQPEMTRAAYQAAIEWGARSEVEVALECDVQFSGDDQLICLHDLSIDRTSTRTGQAVDFSVDQLKDIDFGSRQVTRPTREQRELITLEELLGMVQQARAAGVAVSLVIETKHPNPRGTEVEERVAAMLAGLGWDLAGSPVQIISFCAEAIERVGELLPAITRTFLLHHALGRWHSGDLPVGVRVTGPDLRLVKTDPAYVLRARAKGHAVHVWTVNRPEDIRRCRDLGVTGFTTDDPERTAGVLGLTRAS